MNVNVRKRIWLACVVLVPMLAIAASIRWYNDAGIAQKTVLTGNEIMSLQDTGPNAYKWALASDVKKYMTNGVGGGSTAQVWTNDGGTLSTFRTDAQFGSNALMLVDSSLDSFRTLNAVTNIPVYAKTTQTFSYGNPPWSAQMVDHVIVPPDAYDAIARSIEMRTSDNSELITNGYFSRALHVENYIENPSPYGGAIYGNNNSDPSAAIFGQYRVAASNPVLTNSQNFAIYGYAESSGGFQAGVVGSADNTSALTLGLRASVGVIGTSYGSSFSVSTNIGGYFETINSDYANGFASDPVWEPSVILADSRDSDLPLLIARTNNGTVVAAIDKDGIFHGNGSGLSNILSAFTVQSNQYFFETNIYVNQNLTVNSNLTVNQKITAKTMIVTNLFYDTATPREIAWAGPTNQIDFSLSSLQFYQTYTPVSVTNYTGTTNGYGNSCLLVLSNAASSNISFYLPSGIRLGNGASSPVTVSNGTIYEMWFYWSSNRFTGIGQMFN